MSDFKKARAISLLKDARNAIASLEKELSIISQTINAHQYKKTA